MNATDLWNDERPVRESLGPEYVPDWIDEDVDGATVAAIVQGGCASGAYMPAVTYHEASETMGRHGDDVLDWIEEMYGEVPEHRPVSYQSIAVFYLSVAVELWAAVMAEKLTEEG